MKLELLQASCKLNLGMLASNYLLAQHWTEGFKVVWDVTAVLPLAFRAVQGREELKPTVEGEVKVH